VDWVLVSQLSVLLCRLKAIMCFKLGRWVANFRLKCSS